MLFLCLQLKIAQVYHHLWSLWVFLFLVSVRGWGERWKVYVRVQLQLYVFISEPQLSFNWYGRKKMVDSWTVKWMRQSTCTGLMPRVWLKVHISEKHRCSRSKFNTTVHVLEEWCECVLEANIVSLLMWEKQIDVRSFSLFCVGSCLSSSSSFPPSLSLPLFLRCERGEARWVAMSEGMQQWGRWSFISLWKVYFSLVNRHGCILDSPSQSPSFSLHFSVFFLSSFASLSLPLSFSLPASYLELYRGQIEGIIFLRLNFSAMQWYWRSHSAPVSKINQKHFSTAAINALAAFQPLCLFPISDT